MSNARWYRLKKSFSVFPGGETAIAAPGLGPWYLHRLATRSLPRRLIDRVVAIGFRAWVGVRAKAIGRKCGLGADWIAKAARIGRARMIDPQEIVMFHIEREEDCDAVIRRFEMPAIAKRINPRNWADDCVLNDKLLFAERCAAADLPHPPLVALNRGGATEVRGEAGGGALFIKDIGGSSAKGAQTVTPPAGVAGEALAQWLNDHVKAKGWMAQPRMTPHPALRPLVGDVLSTARIVTIKNERGEPELVVSAFRCPLRRDAIVDNRGLIAPIDPATGALGLACKLYAPGDLAAEWAAHPENGAAIEGMVLPDWPEVEPLTLRAHRDTFPEYSMIGWDVAFSAEGPILLEGNGKPSMAISQRGRDRGVWNGRFGELIAFHIDRALIGADQNQNGSRR